MSSSSPVKSFLTLTAFVGLIVLTYFVLQPSGSAPASALMPWDISVTAEGGTSVFDIELKQSSLDQSLTVLGEDHDIAIIIDSDERAGLEVYYSHFKAGPIAGKLILAYEVDDGLLRTMAEGAAHSSYMASGARKFQLSEEDLHKARNFLVNSISLVPAAALRAEIITQRFGKPERVLDQDGDIQHFLYPDLGLAVSIHQEAKDLLQYVHPDDFDRLIERINPAKNTKVEADNQSR